MAVQLITVAGFVRVVLYGFICIHVVKAAVKFTLTGCFSASAAKVEVHRDVKEVTAEFTSRVLIVVAETQIVVDRRWTDCIELAEADFIIAV